MSKRSTNLNRWRKASSAEAVADLMQHYGVSADDLRNYARRKAGTRRQSFTCPRCGAWVEAEVSNYDGAATCPACENEVKA